MTPLGGIPLWDITGKRVLILGAQGLVGSALVRRLKKIDCEIIPATRGDANLMDADVTAAFIKNIAPDALILAAAKVGGIGANETYPVQFLEENLLIELNVMRAAHAADVDRVLFLGSSCIYPKMASQPISESSLLTGLLESTNDAYALAKIAGIRLVDAYRQQYGRRWISAMPTNLYGPNDNFDLETSHVLPALLRKFHEAKLGNLASVEIWGTGTARREFMYVDDCADALIHTLCHYDELGPINIGIGDDMSINDVAALIANITGFSGQITHDLSKADGTPVKRLNIERLSKLGWSPKTDLVAGLEKTYLWYVEAVSS